MNKFEELMENFKSGLLSNLTIAILAIIHWMDHATGMTNSTLEILMQALGYTFDTSTLVLTANGTNYTFYQLLEYACAVLYPAEDTLRDDIMRNALSIVFRLGYITETQKTTLEAML